MKKSDGIFIVAVAAYAAVFSAASLSHFGKVIADRAADARATVGVAGEARDLDLEKLKRLIREKYLSGHEALFYKKAGEVPESTATSQSEAAPPRDRAHPE